jgi:hypothetical protein
MACPQLPDPLTHPVGEGPPAARPGFLFGGPQTKRRRPAGTTERRRPLRVTRGLASQVSFSLSHVFHSAHVHCDPGGPLRAHALADSFAF